MGNRWNRSLGLTRSAVQSIIHQSFTEGPDNRPLSQPTARSDCAEPYLFTLVSRLSCISD